MLSRALKHRYVTLYARCSSKFLDRFAIALERLASDVNPATLSIYQLCKKGKPECHFDGGFRLERLSRY